VDSCIQDRHSVDMDISMDIHRESVDMDMDMDGKFHIHGKPDNFAARFARLSSNFVQSLTTAQPAHYKCSRSKGKGQGHGVKVQVHRVT